MATTHRAFTGAVFALLFCLGLFFNRTQPLVPWIVSLATLWGAFEYYHLASKKEVRAQTLFGCAISLWLVVEAYHIGLGRLPLILTSALLGSFVLQLLRGGQDRFISGVAITFFGCFYVGLPMAMAMETLHAPGHHAHSRFLIFFVIIGAWASDVGAYFAGRAWGKTPLAPTLSPKKTVEGFLGGLVMTFITVSGFKMLFPQEGSQVLSWPEVIGLGLVFWIVGLAGDLVESALKRDAGVKDSGLDITGHGGMLDIVDSLLFCLPVFYLHLKHIHPLLAQ